MKLCLKASWGLSRVTYPSFHSIRLVEIFLLPSAEWHANP